MEFCIKLQLSCLSGFLCFMEHHDHEIGEQHDDKSKEI